MVRALCCDAQLCALHQRHAAHGTTVTAEEERDIVTRMVLTDGARRRRSFEEACATVAATVTSVSAAALGVGEESQDKNEMGPEEEPLGAMRSEGATDLGD
jgi:plasmid stability protein